MPRVTLTFAAQDIRAPSNVGTDAKAGALRQMQGMQVDKGDARLPGPPESRNPPSHGLTLIARAIRFINLHPAHPPQETSAATPGITRRPARTAIWPIVPQAPLAPSGPDQ